MRDLLMEQVFEKFKALALTSSRIEKQNIINVNKEDTIFLECLQFLLGSDLTTGLSVKKINKNSDSVDFYPTSSKLTILDMMKYLRKHNTGTDADIAFIQWYIVNQEEQYHDMLKEFFCKELKLGIDAKTVNSVIEDLIKTFNVQLGTSIEKVKLKGDEKIFISQKMNGTRLLCLGNNKAMSRSGKEYVGVNHILEDIESLGLAKYAVDGELLYKNKEGLSDSEAFQKGTGLANSKAEDKSDLKMVIFDILPLEEFWNGKSKLPYSSRKMILSKIKEDIEELGLENVEIVPMFYEGYDHSEIWKWLEYAEDNDLEGVIVNLDTPYECKRTKNLIKVKQFYDISLRVTDVLIAESGKYKGKVQALRCKFYNGILDVGVGLNDEMRESFASNPELIVGQIINIKYKEVTKNKQGGTSLQFPVYNFIVTDKDIPDDEDENIKLF